MSTSRERVSIDVVENLPLIVRRELRILAAFARLKAVTEWATDKSYSDESLYGGTHPSHLPCARRKRITAESWGLSPLRARQTLRVKRSVRARASIP